MKRRAGALLGAVLMVAALVGGHLATASTGHAESQAGQAGQAVDGATSGPAS